MSLYLFIKKGATQGQLYEVQEGLKISRSKEGIRLKDKKVSNFHAFIERQEGQLYVVDNKSSNGLKYKDQKVKKLKLEPGLVFKIGDSLLEVRKESGWTKATEKQQPVVVAFPNKPEPKPLEWYQNLAQLCRELKAAPSPQTKTISAFKPALKLTFIQGYQLDTVWYLAYGPRSIGPKSFDLPIYEENTPDICFTIEPYQKQIVFKTDFNEQILINNQKLSKKAIAPGDKIRINETVIEIEFIEE